MTVYLIHFHEPLHHARHYLGSTDNLEERMACHRNGDGARLMEVVEEQGISWEVVRTWKGGRQKERELKAQKNSPRLCPICKEQRMKKTKLRTCSKCKTQHIASLTGCPHCDKRMVDTQMILRLEGKLK